MVSTPSAAGVDTVCSRAEPSVIGRIASAAVRGGVFSLGVGLLVTSPGPCSENPLEISAGVDGGGSVVVVVVDGEPGVGSMGRRERQVVVWTDDLQPCRCGLNIQPANGETGSGFRFHSIAWQTGVRCRRRLRQLSDCRLIGRSGDRSHDGKFGGLRCCRQTWGQAGDARSLNQIGCDRLVAGRVDDDGLQR